ncbi:hypothetical protein KGF87_00385 [Mammaliicoccus fleurettii]|nr:hypothetical protein [Mammaliicoccus fleurettii]MBS3670855.1 hypothetical protein [Mammaliicoccus fleurettii]
MELAVIKGEEGFTLQEAIQWCEAENVYSVRRICNEYLECEGQRYKRYYLKNIERS